MSTLSVLNTKQKSVMMYVTMMNMNFNMHSNLSVNLNDIMMIMIIGLTFDMFLSDCLFRVISGPIYTLEYDRA